jgi:hypothetical protein
MTPPNPSEPPGAQRAQGEPGELHETHESNQTLWLLAASPLIWAAHFLASYILAAVWCAKYAGRDGSLESVRVTVAVLTVLALAGIGVVGWLGYRRHTYGDAGPPHDFDTPQDRHRFLGFATVLLSALSAVATLYVALAAVFMETCH